MKLPKTVKWISSVVIVILVIFMVGFVSDMQNQIRKDFKIKFDEFQTIFLDITSVIDNERDGIKCMVIMNTVEMHENIEKLDQILMYMNDNATKEREITVKDGLQRYADSIKEFIIYDSKLSDGKLTVEDKRKISNDYMCLIILQRNFTENLKNHTYLV